VKTGCQEDAIVINHRLKISKRIKERKDDLVKKTAAVQVQVHVHPVVILVHPDLPLTILM
jgi:hypothetical protein